MRRRKRRRSHDTKPKVTPRRPAVDENCSRKEHSATAVAAEALRTGILPAPGVRRERISHEAQTIRVGDPDDDSLANEYVGEETPGGSTPTPDQNSVDDIGRAYGLQEEDTGALRSGAEVLDRRDRHRVELQAPQKPRP